jgi:hypothetical protein
LLQFKHNKHFFILCVCSLSHLTREAHAPCYIIIYGLSGSIIFFHIISTKRTIFGKRKVTEHKTCVWFSLQLVSETLVTLTIIQRVITTNVQSFAGKVRFQSTLILPERFSKKFSDIKLRNTHNGSRIGPCRWTYGRTDIAVLQNLFPYM